MIEAILFDGDGCAYDTIDHATEATLRAAHRLNETATTPATIRAAFSSGLSLHEIFSIAAPHTDPHDMSTMFYSEGDMAGYSAIRCFPGVHEILKHLLSEDRLTGLVTNRNRKSTMQILAALDLDAVTLDVVTSDDVTAHKPNPEGIYKILESRGILPKHAVYIGDTGGDMTTAHNAGLFACIGFTNGFGTTTQLLEAGATTLMHSWDQLPEIIRSFE